MERPCIASCMPHAHASPSGWCPPGAALPAIPPSLPAAGVLDDEDGYGEGATLEDYVTHDTVEDYDGAYRLNFWWSLCLRFHAKLS